MKVWNPTAIAGAFCLLLVSTAKAGPPFRTDDPEPVDYQHWEFYAFSAGTHVAGDTSGVLPGIEINYGVIPDVQLHLVAPLAYDHPDGSGTKFSYGDTELGVKYRFVRRTKAAGSRWSVFSRSSRCRPGNAERGLGTGHAHVFLPIWLQKGFGRWLTYGGGG
jgi:hypothetical protein